MTKYYDRAWNPIIGCQGKFDGCENCYARTLMKKRTGKTDFHKVKLNYKQIKNRFSNEDNIIAVCTQSDLFQNEVYFSTIDGILRKCNKYKNKKFLFQTKYSKNLFQYFSNPNLMKILNNNHLDKFAFNNFYFGVSVCSKNDLNRISQLQETPLIKHRFISFEPVLEDIADAITDDMLKGIEWVVIGSETGENHRPCNIEWLIKIAEKLNKHNIKFYTSSIQLDNGEIILDAEIDKMPEILRRNDLII